MRGQGRESVRFLVTGYCVCIIRLGTSNERCQPLINDAVLAGKPHFLYPLYTRLLAIVLTKRTNRRIGTTKIGVRKTTKTADSVIMGRRKQPEHTA
jgi:hypothetical protein